MKKTLFALIFAFSLYMGSPQVSNAIWCTNCSQLWQQLMEYAKQGAQYVSQVATEASSLTTAIEQTASTFNQVVFRPLQDALMLASIFRSADVIKNLVLGGLNGQVSLLKTNPELYLKQQGVIAQKVNVNYVDKANGVYSNSIIGSVVSQARVASDIEGTLGSLSKSSIPSIVQKELCEDSKLTAVAQNDVGSSDPAAVAARKGEIYGKLCTGNPNTDPALAQALTAAGEATGAGGWDVFLAKTAGDNTFTKTNLALAVIEKNRLEKIAAKETDRILGKGIVSKTECTAQSSGKAGTVCAETIITNLGYQLSESFKSAINAPLDVMKNAFGTGGTFSSILGSVASIVGSVQSIQQSLNSVTGTAAGLTNSIGNGLQISLGGAPVTNPPSSLTPTTGGTVNDAGQIVSVPVLTDAALGTNVTPDVTTGSTGAANTVTNTNTSYYQDLINNSEGKANLITNLTANIETELGELDGYKSSNSEYILAIEGYLGSLGAVGTCYSNLVKDFPNETIGGVFFPSLANNSRVIDATRYITSETKTNTDLKKKITDDQLIIDREDSLMRSALTSLRNSNSTEEIAFLFGDLSKKLEALNAPDRSTLNSEVARYKMKVEEATRDLTGIEGAESSNGILTVKNNICKEIRTTEQTARQNATNNAASNNSNII